MINRQSRFKKTFAVLLSLMLMLPIFTFNIPAMHAADNTPPVRQALKEYKGTPIRPDISDLIEKKASLSDSEKKLSSKILQLTGKKEVPDGLVKGKLISEMKEQKQIFETPGANSSSGISVYVYVQLKQGTNSDILKPYIAKLKNEDKKSGLVTALADVDSLNDLASLDEVLGIQEVTAPVVNTGSALSEGDAILQTDDVRSQLGADGTGVKIGIISDGVDHLTNAVSSGDLPADVTVLSNTEGGDEGTAMLEIVYDLAPGADLYFHDCGSSTLDFNDAVDDLVSAGCDIICDDIMWITEPFFEDGTVASHIAGVIGSGVVYVCAAGNAAGSHHQGMFYEDSEYPGWADLSQGTGTSDLYAALPNGGSIMAVLEWNDAFGSSGNDYDLYLYNADSGDLLAGSENEQSGSGNPQEMLSYQNTSGSPMNVGIAVHKYSGAAKTLEIYTYTKNGAYMYTNNITESDSIFSQAAVPGVLSCGAVYSGSPGTIEGFSSQGPVTMLSETRQKPDICGIDGVSVTGAGGFSNPFYGTSAAAPHIAAVAALLESRFPAKTPSEIRQLILDYGVDLGSAGYDSIYGYGRCDALAAALDSVFVTFDSQGGTAVDMQTLSVGDKVTQPADPTQDGYVFQGWYSNIYPHDCNMWGFDNDTVTTDTILYAKWTDPSLGTPYVVPTSVSYSAIQISWDAVTDADGYEVWYATRKYGTYSLKYTSYSGAAGSWTRYGLTTDKTYYFMVRAFKAVGGVKMYGPDSTIQSTAPGRPTMSVVATSPTSAAVSWVTVEGSDGYEIWRGTQKNGVYSLKGTASSSSTSWVNVGLTTDKAYYYQVRAFRWIGGVKTFSEFSSINSVVPSADDHLNAPYVIPTSTSYTAIQISWDAVPGASGYEVWYATRKFGTYSLKYTSYSGAAGSWTKGGLTTDKTYYFMVRAFQTVGGVNIYGPDSSIQSTSPGRPTITVTRASSTSATISWVPISGAAGYEVWRGTQKNGVYSLKYTASSSETSLTNGGLTTGKAYYYQVRAFRMIGGVKVYSEFSSINSVVP